LDDFFTLYNRHLTARELLRDTIDGNKGTSFSLIPNWIERVMNTDNVRDIKEVGQLTSVGKVLLLRRYALYSYTPALS
jgi:hypothetical protein